MAHDCQNRAWAEPSNWAGQRMLAMPLRAKREHQAFTWAPACPPLFLSFTPHYSTRSTEPTCCMPAILRVYLSLISVSCAHNQSVERVQWPGIAVKRCEECAERGRRDLCVAASSGRGGAWQSRAGWGRAAIPAPQSTARAHPHLCPGRLEVCGILRHQVLPLGPADGEERQETNGQQQAQAPAAHSQSVTN